MPKIVVADHLTLDGVMQAPGRPDEDQRDGFNQGGWGTAALGDPLLVQKMGEAMG